MNLGPVLIGIDGVSLNAESRQALRHPIVGGVVLFTRNFESKQQLTDLTAEIRALRDPRLLLAVDQEGGRVQRFREGFTRLPPLGHIGRLLDEDPNLAGEHAYWHARCMATEMLAVGIDLSFAPVLDLNRGSEVIGDRAFSAVPGAVVTLGGAYLSGMHDAGMKTTGKHYPGHGSVLLDSHLADVCDDRGFEEIDASDLVPFRALAGALDAMMIAHVVYPCLDRQPAGYSSSWLDGQLRQRTGFGGVIFSDDLGMHAAGSVGGLSQRTHAALDAGCDAVLVCRPDDVAALFEDLDGSQLPDATDPLQALYGLSMATNEIAESLALWSKRLESLQ